MSFEKVKHVVDVLSWHMDFAPWGSMNRIVSRMIDLHGFEAVLQGAREVQCMHIIKKWDKASQERFKQAFEEARDPVLKAKRDQVRTASKRARVNEQRATAEWVWFLNFLRCIENKIPAPHRSIPKSQCPKHLEKQWDEVKPIWDKIKDKRNEGEWLYG